MFRSNPDIKSARILSAGIILYLSIFLQFAWKSIMYSSIVLPACLQLLYLRYQIFFLAGEANFIRNTCWKYPQLVIKVFISSYHLAAALTRYPPMIWNFLYSDHLFASAILLYHSNHSLGSFASVPQILWVSYGLILFQHDWFPGSLLLMHLLMLLHLNLILSW